MPFLIITTNILWIFFALWLFGHIKRKMLKNTGLNDFEIEMLFSKRDKNFSLKSLCEKYDERKLMRADAIGRKGLHVASLLFALLSITIFSQSDWQELTIGMIVLVIFALLVILAYLNIPPNKFNLLIFSATSRIRDGQQGRLNFLISHAADFSGLCCIIVFIFWSTSRGINDIQQDYLLYLIYFPLVLGDAAGEIIGACWGKARLRVIGIGEINRKSFLGTFAVFIFSLIPLVFITWIMGQPFSFYWLCLLIASVTMIVELIAPRSTDNFFIPASSALIIMLFV